MNFFGLIEVSYSWIREVSNTYICILLDCVIVKFLWFAFLILFKEVLFGTPIASDNGLPLLIENIFQTPSFYLDSPPPVYWYLGCLSDPLPLFFIRTFPIIWNWRVRVNEQIKNPRAVSKERPFVIFDSFSFFNAKRLSIKAFLEVTLVLLILRARTVF